MSAATFALAGGPSAAPAGLRQKEPTALAAWPQGQWQPRPRRGVGVPTSDADVSVAQSDALLVRLGELAPSDPRRIGVRARAIEWYLPLAVYLARRFGGRGEPMADLTQIAVVGLIKAVDRYDAGRGVEFASYAIPTILGEIKRHFRDTVWSVRVPRRLQELKLHLSAVTEELAHALHRSPTTAELATRLGVSPGDVQAARRCAGAYRPLSFEQSSSDVGDLRLIDLLGGPDPGIEAVDRREALRRRLDELPARERRIIGLRYFAEMTQAQIAADVGVSQMQVSRLLTQTLSRLHTGMLADVVGER
jgi:RNA polymerase sigma-B factor